MTNRETCWKLSLCATSHTVDKDWRFSNAAALFGVGKPDLARLIKDAQTRTDSALDRADFDLILALQLATQSPSDRQEAMKMFENMQSLNLPGAYYGALLETPLFVGDCDGARKAAEEYLELPRLAHEWRWFKHTIEHYAGVLPEEKMLRMAGPFSNARCMAHFSIGLKALSCGEREKARSQFELVVATRQIGWYNYHLAKGFLLRMNRDSAWPGWIDSGDSDPSTRN